jgi:hypothetical protein
MNTIKAVGHTRSQGLLDENDASAFRISVYIRIRAMRGGEGERCSRKRLYRNEKRRDVCLSQIRLMSHVPSCQDKANGVDDTNETTQNRRQHLRWGNQWETVYILL